MPSHRTDPEANRGELAILRQIRARAGRARFPGLALGIGDDCALLRPRPGQQFAVTTDLTICGTHFRLDWHSPEAAGHRALARGLSDLAAMGAKPVAAFLSLGLPRELANPSGTLSASWASRFVDGLLDLAAAHKTPLAGGDLSETPIALADIVLIGSVPAGRALLRSTARPGHLLYVTGWLGGGAAALPHFDRLAKQSPRENQAKPSGLPPSSIPKHLKPLLDRRLYPQPRIAQGLRLRTKSLASAAIDLSDGLSTDLTHLCEESHVAAEVDSTLLPIHPGADLNYALHGGDDYELLFTAAPGAPIPRQIAGVPVSCIGSILGTRKGRPTITLLTPQGPRPVTPQGWEHFS
jgi:thiamine-monophosphate kinase